MSCPDSLDINYHLAVHQIVRVNGTLEMNVILYTRSGCHLCDIAHQTLVAHGLQPKKVDIETSKTLREKFNTCVPVVEIDGKIRFRGQVDPLLLRRLLRNSEGQHRC